MEAANATMLVALANYLNYLNFTCCILKSQH